MYVLPSATCQHIVREIRACKEAYGATVVTRSPQDTRHMMSEMIQSQTDCRSLRVVMPDAARH